MKTALERLQENALNGLSPLARLKYLVDARAPDGTYSHWGLTKMYGETTLQQAMSQTHTSAFVDVLRTPVDRLADEIVCNARAAGVTPETYLRTISERVTTVSPENHLGGCEEHLKMILFVLSCLARRLQ